MNAKKIVTLERGNCSLCRHGVTGYPVREQISCLMLSCADCAICRILFMCVPVFYKEIAGNESIFDRGSVYKVPVLSKHRMNQSFKEYLNTIRLTDAQGLPDETDRQITEIALTVGYNNVSHFNRIFKQKMK